PQRGQPGLLPQREVHDGQPVGVQQRLPQQLVRLDRLRRRLQVVRLVVEHGVDLVHGDEAEHLDLVRFLDRQRVEVLLGQDHRAAVVALVRLGDLRELDDLAVQLTGPLVADPSAVLGVHLVKTDVLVLGGAVHLDRHVDQPERQGALPDRSHPSMMDHGCDSAHGSNRQREVSGMPPAQKTLVEIDGHRFTLTNLDKVLYPATGTTKAEVINYYAQIATVMLPLVRGRPVTRKRWPNGVEAEPFFQKNVDAATPTWMPRQRIEHRSGAIDYPLASSPAALAWFGQNGALELHVPQWQFTSDGLPGNPDRMVFH